MSEKALPIVLIPGFMLDAALWNDFTEACTEKREFIYADLTSGNSISEIARNIVADLPARFILMGFSLGGYIARAVMEQCPNRVAGMILVATSLREDTPEQKKNKLAAVNAMMSADFKGLSRAAITRSLHPDRADDKALIAKIRAMSIRLGAEVFRVQSGLVRSNITRTPVTCPTLIIVARQDRLRTPEEAREIMTLIANAELELVEECGHMIPLEKPHELARITKTWFGKTGLL